MRSRLSTDGCRKLAAVIEAEGGTIASCANKKNHLQVRYTFDGITEHCTYMSRHRSVGDVRATLNFRAELRRNKRGTP